MLNSRTSLSLILALVLVPACSGTEAEASGGSVRSAPTADAIADADSNELARMHRALLQDVGATLKSVEDKASAQAALPELEGLADAAEAMGARLQDLMQGGGEVTDRLELAEQMMGSLQDGKGMMAELERLDGVAGVREVLEPQMNRIVRMFESR